MMDCFIIIIIMEMKTLWIENFLQKNKIISFYEKRKDG